MDGLVGKKLGKYEIRSKLGEGGMGAVYRAYNPDLEFDVAIKVLRTDLQDADINRERFRREAQTVARLEHSNIVPVYDYGTDGGYSYIVMKYLRGGTLQDRVHPEKPPLTLGETNELLKQLASALDYAHSQGVIHRDVKASNVIFDLEGKPYLVDFGLAKLADQPGLSTRTGLVMGTAFYMSPEQWNADPLTAATDQYSLGVLIYLLVTSRLPFVGPIPSLMKQHLQDYPQPPHTVWRSLSPTLGIVIKRAMDKEPSKRFKTITLFAQKFGESVEGKEDLSPGSAVEQTKPGSGSLFRRFVTPALLIVVILLLAGVLAVLVSSLSTPAGGAEAPTATVVTLTPTLSRVADGGGGETPGADSVPDSPPRSGFFTLDETEESIEPTKAVRIVLPVPPTAETNDSVTPTDAASPEAIVTPEPRVEEPTPTDAPPDTPTDRPADTPTFTPTDVPPDTPTYTPTAEPSPTVSTPTATTVPSVEPSPTEVVPSPTPTLEPSPIPERTPCQRADVNANGEVDIFDLRAVAAAYGSTQANPQYRESLDPNADGSINIFDLRQVAAYYGQICE